MRILFLCLFLVYPFWIFGQIDESDTTFFQLRSSLSANLQKGNVEVWALRAKLDMTFNPSKKIIFKTQNAYLYQKFFLKKSDEDIFSRNFLYYKPERKVYPYSIAFISTNFRRKIDLRYFIGGGATWQIVRRKNTILKLSSGLIYESSRFKENRFNQEVYNGANEIRLWRVTSWIFGKHHLFSNHLRLFYDVYWQPALDNMQNYRWQTDIALEFPVWKGLVFNALYTYTHENTVVQNIKQTDQLLTFGLAYTLRTYHSK